MMPYVSFHEEYRDCWSCHARRITEGPVLIAGTSEANANLARLCGDCMAKLMKRVANKMSKRKFAHKQDRDDERERLRAVDLLAYKLIHDPESYDRVFVLEASGHPLYFNLADWIQWREVERIMIGRRRSAIEQATMTGRASDVPKDETFNSHEFEGPV